MGREEWREEGGVGRGRRTERTDWRGMAGKGGLERKEEGREEVNRHSLYMNVCSWNFLGLPCPLLCTCQLCL